MSGVFTAQQVLELACAAQRINNNYIKDTEPVYSDDYKILAYKWSNKILMMTVLAPDNIKPLDELKPQLLRITNDDKEFAVEIQKYYRRLMFAAIEGENEFQTEVNSLLNADTIPPNKLGFIACLPSVYKRDYARQQMEKRAKSVSSGFLAEIGSNILDKDCEIMSSQRSKNFEAYNIDAIIDNKMVSWMSKTDLKMGACVVVKAKVKDHSKHWKFETDVTRLNYVKAAQ